MTVHFGDCRDVMRAMIERGEKAQMCVTSPPYYGLRDYGAEGQIGLEATLHEFIDTMVEVFALVWDLLEDDGTLWLNLGDSYAGSWGAQGRQGESGQVSGRSGCAARQIAAAAKRESEAGSLNRAPGLKTKELMGAPWRVAFALQEWGWYLRQDIIWHKPNPMPESVRDRCTKAHEYIFLLSKQPRYYFDQEAIKEQAVKPGGPGYKTPDGWDTGAGGHGAFHKDGREKGHTGYKYKSVPGQRDGGNSNITDSLTAIGPIERKNKRSVWTVPSEAFAGAHFATFPQALIEPCILAGSRSGDTVLDPFFGSGTTGQVCNRLGRKYIGIELNRDYEPLQLERTAQQGLEL